MNFKIAAHKISEELGEKIEKFLGSGDFGSVFLLESGKVLKITSDRNEIIIAKKLTKNKNLFKYILNYYNVGEIEDGVYFILMDYIEPVNEWERRTISFVFSHVLQFSKSFYKSVMSPQIDFFIEDRFKKYKARNADFLRKFSDSEIEDMKKFALSLVPHIKNIAKELKIHNIEQCDFHGGNLGWNENHELVLFDITKPYDPKNEPKPILKKYALFEYNSSFPSSNNYIADIRAKEVADELNEELIGYLGGSAFGHAYETKSGKVLKITSDENEFHLALKLSKNKNWMKCLINFYNVGMIKPEFLSDDDLFTFDEGDYRCYILMDKVLPLSKDEKDALDAYMNIIQYNVNYWSDIRNKKEVDRKLDSYLSSDPNYPPRKTAEIIYPYVLKIAKELKLHGIIETDFHGENLGWDKDRENLVLFDIGGDTNTQYRSKNKFKIIMTSEKLTSDFLYEWTTKNPIIDSRIKEISEELGEEIINYLGKGSFGFAFKTKSGKVLKITSDDDEANVTYKLAKNRNWMKCVVNYYNVGLIKPKKESTWWENNGKFDIYKYYILMDFTEPLTEDEKYAIDCYSGTMQNNLNYYQDLLNKDEVFDTIEFMFEPKQWNFSRIKAQGKDPEKIKQIAKDFYPKILKMAKELKLYGVKETDFHSENVGWDKNRENLIIYDLSSYKSTTIPGKFKSLSTTEKLITRFKRF